MEFIPRSSSWREKILVTILGGLLIIAGVIMLALPGPGWLTIIAGIAIWGREYRWAWRLERWFKAKIPRRRPRSEPPADQAPKE
ncbi:PGPGW domain-containing protein [bacterium]|nr:MAG: PGPGW domain-containing protein [bacterium]